MIWFSRRTADDAANDGLLAGLRRWLERHYGYRPHRTYMRGGGSSATASRDGADTVGGTPTAS